jgi:Lon protease-like protein
VELPLFPLSTVLHPGLPIFLHVFEDRYWEMFGRALDGERRFGWSLSSTAMRSAGPPSTTRSAAWPRSATSGATPTGRLDVVARAERRFRIEGVTQAAQYIAIVATLGESAGERATERIVPVARLFNPLCHHPAGDRRKERDRAGRPARQAEPAGHPVRVRAPAHRGALLRRELSLLEQLGIAGPARPTLPFSLK